MAIVRSYTDSFQIIDRTQEVVSIPNTIGIINQLGIFSPVQGITTNTVSFEDIAYNTAVMTDQFRGQRGQYAKDATRKLRSYPVPHFPLDDSIKPEDIQGKSAYGTNDQAETQAGVTARKLETIRRSGASLLEISRAKLLEDGSVYAPNGTVSVNFYSDFGVTRKEIDFVFGTSTTDIIGKTEEGIAYLTDNAFAGGLGATDHIALCHPTFFANLIKHPKVQTAYTYFQSAVNPLRERLNSGLPMNTRQFIYGGIRYIEYRVLKPDGTPYVPAGEARLIPQGMTDVFETFAAPANKMGIVNTMGQEMYVFEYADFKGNGIEIEAESNIINVCKKPQLIIRLYSST